MPGRVRICSASPPGMTSRLWPFLSARAAMASLECLPAFLALRLNGATTPGWCFGRSRGADAGRTARRPAAAAARAGVTNPPAAPRDDAGDSNRLDPATSVALGDRRDVDPPARRC